MNNFGSYNVDHLSKLLVTLSSMFPDFHAMMQRLPLYMYSREGTSWSIEKENRSPTTTWIYYHYQLACSPSLPAPACCLAKWQKATTAFTYLIIVIVIVTKDKLPT